LKASFIALLFPLGREFPIPEPETIQSIEQACEVTPAQGSARCASRGFCYSKKLFHKPKAASHGDFAKNADANCGM